MLLGLWEAAAQEAKREAVEQPVNLRGRTIGGDLALLCSQKEIIFWINSSSRVGEDWDQDLNYGVARVGFDSSCETFSGEVRQILKIKVTNMKYRQGNETALILLQGWKQGTAVYANKIPRGFFNPYNII